MSKLLIEVDHTQTAEDSAVSPEVPYRMLRVGERLQRGDQWHCQGTWRPCTHIVHGEVVPTWRYGYYRRPKK